MNSSDTDDASLDDVGSSRISLLINILNRIPAMVGYWDTELRNRMANDAYVDFFGQTPSSMRGIHIREVLGEELFAKNLPFIERVLAGEVQLFDRTIIDPHGRPRYTQASYIPDVVDGAVHGFIVLVTEITERRLAEEALRRSEENLDVTLRSMGEAVVAYDADGFVTRLNPAAERLVGWTADEAIGRPFTEVVQLRDDQRTLIDRTGRRLHVAVTAAPIHDRDGNTIGRVKVIRDITEDQRVREELAKSASMLERTGRIARVGGWEIDLVTGQRHWLPEVYRILEMDPGNLPPTDDLLARHLDPEPAQAVRDAIQAGRESGTPWDLEMPMTTALGRPIWVRTKGEAMAEDGVVVRLIGTFQDITERKQLEAQLLRANRMEAVGRLAGGVAHDFNNMLGVILGRTELAAASADLAAIRGDLGEIKIAAERSAELTRQLLTFARQQTVSPTVIAVNETITDLLVLLKRFVGDDIVLTLRTAGESWNVEIDRSQLDQIMTNLCLNAHDAIGDRVHGTVMIEIETVVVGDELCAQSPDATPGEFVRISVVDNGSGIDEVTFAQMYEPFYTTKQFGANSGLGLATVLGAVTQNGGFVIAATEMGVGTRFDVYLPRHPGAVTAVEPLEAVAPGAPSGSVLVVEDEPSLCTLVVRVLESEGYRVLSASSAAAALVIAAEHRGNIDVLLTDVIMPESNGVQLADDVGGTDPTVVPIFMSGYPADIVTDRADAEIRFLQKPFSVAALCAAVRSAMDQAVAGS